MPFASVGVCTVFVVEGVVRVVVPLRPHRHPVVTRVRKNELTTFELVTRDES